MNTGFSNDFEVCVPGFRARGPSTSSGAPAPRNDNVTSRLRYYPRAAQQQPGKWAATPDLPLDRATPQRRIAVRSGVLVWHGNCSSCRKNQPGLTIMKLREFLKGTAAITAGTTTKECGYWPGSRAAGIGAFALSGAAAPGWDHPETVFRKPPRAFPEAARRPVPLSALHRPLAALRRRLDRSSSSPGVLPPRTQSCDGHWEDPLLWLLVIH
jgi:hypothetical protein